jgi:hypothetical protein
MNLNCTESMVAALDEVESHYSINLISQYDSILFASLDTFVGHINYVPSESSNQTGNSVSELRRITKLICGNQTPSLFFLT